MTKPAASATHHQLLEVIDRQLAEQRFHAALDLSPVGVESVPLGQALGRVLAEDVRSRIDVPSFDRSNLDGFAVRAADTYGSSEEVPRRLRLADEIVATAVVPQTEVAPGLAVSIATGGMLPRGADAIVMVEHADADGHELLVRKSVTPGFGVSFAGTDIAIGETVIRRGDRLTSRDTGILAAIGAAHVRVWKKPTVAIISTGNEIIPPDEPMTPGMVYDSNSRILADAVVELGGAPHWMGIVRDDLPQLNARLDQALRSADVVLLSGGTSKGTGDLSYRAVQRLQDPGVVAHGVALKPGKPICLAASRGKPVVILPGFPTSAVFTFHEFVAPVLQRLVGCRPEPQQQVPATMAVKVNSDAGRTEYLLVGLVSRPEATDAEQQLAAYPMGKGSGSVTAFSRADGFVTIARHEEIVETGQPVQVTLLGHGLRLADLVVIGSHCIGLDLLLGLMHEQGWRTKFLAVGSTAGLHAAQRGECDLAGIHLLDPASGAYNRPFVTDDLMLLSGYRRLQGIVYRVGDERFGGDDPRAVVARVARDGTCMMVNRNQGSGTRVLIDQLLDGRQPNGHAIQARNHHAVVAAVVQGRADWGVAIEHVAHTAGLGFLPVAHEQFDFVIPKSRWDQPAVQAWRELIRQESVRRQLAEIGCDSAE